MQSLVGRPDGTAFGEGWVRSTCIICLNRCGILAHLNEDGIVDKILGDPDNPHNHGRTCAKGDSGFEGLRDGRRITTPLRRTNPKKGIGIDPQWEEISWDDALNEIVTRMVAVLAEDPRRFMFSTFDAYNLRGAFVPAFVRGAGMRSFRRWGAELFCGNNVHGITQMNGNAFELNPDPKYSKYIMLFGSQFGSVVHYDTMHAARELGNRRQVPDELKVVSIDPVCGPAASRAEEWVPIRPGTDAALILGMVNQLVNEFGLYDSEFLRTKTNAPYLIDETGHYLRADDGERPLVWDETTSTPTPFDEAVESAALTGTYEVNGTRARTAFQALAEHVRAYTPERVEEITTVPAQTVVRLAREFGEAAQIGSTIEIDGVELPYRPASVAWYRGLSAHKHAFLTGLAIILLPTLVGALDVPGGLLGDIWGLAGRSPTRKYQCATTSEGLIGEGLIVGGIVGAAYPPREVKPPETPEMFELQPVGPYGPVFYLLTSEKEDVYNPPAWPLMLMQYHSNMVKTAGPPDVMERFMNRIPFIVSIVHRPEETMEFADIVLPGLHYLERLVPFVYPHYSSGDGPLAVYGSKPVVEAPFEGPVDGEPYVDIVQIFLEIAKRAGFLSEVYEAFNTIANLKPEYRLDRDRDGEYSYLEMVDRWLKNEFGPDKGLDWHLADGLWTDEKSVEEKYPRPFISARAQIYFEFMQQAGEQVRAVTDELGIPWETDDYQPLPDFKPCPSFEHEPPYDLYVVNLKMPIHALSHTHRNPLLQTLSSRHNDVKSVWIHPSVANPRGISDGDQVVIETFEGRRQTASARVTQLVHPEVLATQGCGGGWVAGSDQSEVNFNALLSIDEDHIDFLSGALDSCISATVYPQQELAG